MRGVGRSATLPGRRACRGHPGVQVSTLPRSGRRYSTRNIRQRSRRPPTLAIGQHPSSDRPSASLRGGHLLPQGEKGRLPEPLARTCRPIVRGSNLGAAGRAEWSSEFHAIWTVLAPCGCAAGFQHGCDLVMRTSGMQVPQCPTFIRPMIAKQRRFRRRVNRTGVICSILVCIAAFRRFARALFLLRFLSS